MDCCSINGLPQMFGGSAPRKEAESFRKKGLPKRTRPIVDYLQSAGIEGATVLDIGFGVGSLHLELLRRGAGAVMGVEVVDTYIGEAERLASELGLADAVDYQQADFTRIQSDIEPADVVVLDRSICCYPDMPGLVKPSAEHARRFYAIVLPVENIASRLFTGLANVVLRLLRRDFRAYIHPQVAIDEIVERAGLRRVLHKRSGVWKAMIYERQSAPA